MSSKDKKLVQERIKVPAYGDEKIEEAKGKSNFSHSNQVYLPDCILYRHPRASAKEDGGEDHLNKDRHGGAGQKPPNSRGEEQKKESQ